MGMLTTCLIALVGVNVVLVLAGLRRRSVEARMVRQVQAWPGVDTYHAELLSAGEPLCSTDHQPDRLADNSCRAAEVAIRLMRQDGLLRGDGLELVENAAEPAHPVTAAAFRLIGRYQSDPSQLRLGDFGRDPGFQAAVRTHLNALFTHAPAVRRYWATTINDVVLWSYGCGAAAPAVHAYLLMRRTAPTDPDVVKGSFMLACLVFVVALLVLIAQTRKTWSSWLKDREIPLALKELAPFRENAVNRVGSGGGPDAVDATDLDETPAACGNNEAISE
jgi:hypothetical protein